MPCSGGLGGVPWSWVSVLCGGNTAPHLVSEHKWRRSPRHGGGPRGQGAGVNPAVLGVLSSHWRFEFGVEPAPWWAGGAMQDC